MQNYLLVHDQKFSFDHLSRLLAALVHTEEQAEVGDECMQVFFSGIA